MIYIIKGDRFTGAECNGFGRRDQAAGVVGDGNIIVGDFFGPGDFF